MAGEGIDGVQEETARPAQNNEQAHPCRQGSVTWPEAERRALSVHGDHSAESVAHVLTQAGLSLR